MWQLYGLLLIVEFLEVFARFDVDFLDIVDLPVVNARRLLLPPLPLISCLHTVPWTGELAAHTVNRGPLLFLAHIFVDAQVEP